MELVDGASNLAWRRGLNFFLFLFPSERWEPWRRRGEPDWRRCRGHGGLENCSSGRTRSRPVESVFRRPSRTQQLRVCVCQRLCVRVCVQTVVDPQRGPGCRCCSLLSFASARRRPTSNEKKTAPPTVVLQCHFVFVDSCDSASDRSIGRPT